jgi:NTP pyrophosphatase (non-canonical NTP hydrolase)
MLQRTKHEKTVSRWQPAVRANLPLRNKEGVIIDRAAWDEDNVKETKGRWTRPVSARASGQLPRYRLGDEAVQELRRAVPSDEWIKDLGVRYFYELTNMAQLTEEVGEVARIIARRYGEQSEKESDKNKDLGEELADVVFVVLCLANQTGINLQDAFDKKLNIKTQRDHDRHQNNPKLK